MLEQATLALAIGFGLVALGMSNKNFLYLAGLVWMFNALSVFPDYGAGWVIITLGFGMMLLVEGWWGSHEKNTPT